MVMSLMKAKVVGSINRDRPRFVWVDRVRKSLVVKHIVVREARELINDRKVWRVLVDKYENVSLTKE